MDSSIWSVYTCSVTSPDNKLLDALLVLLYSWFCISSLWPTSFGRECSAGLKQALRCVSGSATAGEMLDHFADVLICHSIIPHTGAQTEDGANRLSLGCTVGTSKKPFWNYCQRISIKPTRRMKATQVTRKHKWHAASDWGFTLKSRHQSSILFNCTE